MRAHTMCMRGCHRNSDRDDNTTLGRDKPRHCDTWLASLSIIMQVIPPLLNNNNCHRCIAIYMSLIDAIKSIYYYYAFSDWSLNQRYLPPI